MTIIVLMFASLTDRQPIKSGIENSVGSQVGVKQRKSSAADDGDGFKMPIQN